MKIQNIVNIQTTRQIINPNFQKKFGLKLNTLKQDTIFFTANSKTDSTQTRDDNEVILERLRRRNSDGKFEFPQNKVQNLLTAYEDKKELLYRMLNNQCYGIEPDFSNLMLVADSKIDVDESYKELLKLTKKDKNGNDVPKLTPEEACDVLLFQMDKPEKAKIFLDATYIDDEGNEQLLFSPKLIKKIHGMNIHHQKISKVIEISKAMRIRQGAPISSVEDFEKVIDYTDLYKINPSIFSYLLSAREKNENGEFVPKYTEDEINHFYEFRTFVPKKTMLNLMRIENSYKSTTYEKPVRASEIFDLYTRRNEFTLNSLLNATKINENGEEVPRFNAEEVKILLEALGTKFVAAQKLLKLPQEYQAKELIELMPIYFNMPEFVEECLAKRVKDPNNKRDRYKGIEDTKKLAYCVKVLGKEKYDILMNQYIEDKDGNLVQQFSPDEMLEIADMNIGIDTIDVFIQKVKDETGRLVPRFPFENYPQLVKLKTRNKDFFKLVCGYTEIDEKGVERPRFSYQQINNNFKTMLKFRDIFTEILDMRADIQDGTKKYRFSAIEIDKIVKACVYVVPPEQSEFSEEIRKVINLKQIDKNGEEKYTYTSSEVVEKIKNIVKE